MSESPYPFLTDDSPVLLEGWEGHLDTPPCNECAEHPTRPFTWEMTFDAYLRQLPFILSRWQMRQRICGDTLRVCLTSPSESPVFGDR